MTSKHWMRVGLACVLALFVCGTALGAQEWDFSGVERIELEGVSGDVILLPAGGRGGSVELRADVSPRGSFEPSVEEDGDTLRIRENWSGRSSRFAPPATAARRWIGWPRRSRRSSSPT